MANRTPPARVIKQLRSEVGFGCPVPDCGSPYLTWHHFDPPWNVKNHHHPTGMVALCPIHHIQADQGAFTVDQLRGFKSRQNANEVRARFEWMRQEILTIAGGNFYYNIRTPLIVDDRPVIWFDRDVDGYLLLSLNFPSIADEEGRIRIEKNVWSRIGDPIDLECPPSGRKLRVSYKNGDEISLEFKNLDSGDGFQALYGTKLLWQDLPIPVALLEINLKIAGRNLCLSPHGTNLQAGSLKGVWMRNSAGGLAIS